MKKLILLLLFIPLVSIGQTPYDKGFQAGFKKGYCQDDPIGCISAHPPTSPIPEIGEDFNSYNDGFVRGVIAGKNKKRKDTESSSLTFRGADKTLVEGAKVAAPKFNDYSKGVYEAFSNIPSKSSTNNYTAQYSSPRETSNIYDRGGLNSSIRMAKYFIRQTKKDAKKLLNLQLKVGEIEKGDERYLKLKAQADFGYDPKTEKDPVLVAIENWRKLNDEKLYGVTDITYFDNFHSGELPLSVDEVRNRFKNEYLLYLDENGTILFIDEIDYNSSKKEKIKIFVMSNWFDEYENSEGYSIFYNLDSNYKPTNPYLNLIYDNTGKIVYRVDINEDRTYTVKKL